MWPAGGLCWKSAEPHTSRSRPQRNGPQQSGRAGTGTGTRSASRAPESRVWRGGEERVRRPLSTRGPVRGTYLRRKGRSTSEAQDPGNKALERKRLTQAGVQGPRKGGGDEVCRGEGAPEDGKNRDPACRRVTRAKLRARSRTPDRATVDRASTCNEARPSSGAKVGLATGVLDASRVTGQIQGKRGPRTRRGRVTSHRSTRSRSHATHSPGPQSPSSHVRRQDRHHPARASPARPRPRRPEGTVCCR